MASFKVPCPSCEAPVLIKNPNLIGTKVECPKCKYRFKVEEPAADAAATAGAGAKATATKADDTAKKKPTKTPGKNKKLVKIGVGVGAVVLLIVVGVFAFGGKKGPTPPKGPINTGPNTNNPGDPNTGDPKKKDDPDDSETPGVPKSGKKFTNLLPPQTVAVYRFNMQKMRDTPLYAMIADQQVAAMFQTSMGLAPEDVEAYLHCFVGDNREPYGVIKLRRSSQPADTLAKMSLKDKPKSVKGRDLHVLPSNVFVRAMSQTLSMQSLFGEYYKNDEVPFPPKVGGKERTYGACVYDTQHILLGDYAVVDRFLNDLDADGNPPFKSIMFPASAAPPPPPPEPDPKNPDPKAPDPKGPPPKAPVAPPKAPEPPKPAPDTGDKVYTSIDAYRSLSDYKLKRALDEMEANRYVPAFVYAEIFQYAQYDPKQMKKEYGLLSGILDPIAAKTKYLSANVVAFTPQRLIANVRITTESGTEARAIAKDQLIPVLDRFADLLTNYLSTSKAERIEFRDYTIGGTKIVPAKPNPNPGFPTGDPESTPMMGPMTPPMAGPEGMMGSMSGPPPMPMGGPPPTPMGGPPPMSSMGGPPPMPGPMGGPPPMPGGMNPNPSDPKQPDQPASYIALDLSDNSLWIAIDLNWGEGVYRETIFPRLAGIANQIKGKVAVFTTELSWLRLAAVAPKVTADRDAFPRGTFKREAKDTTRMGFEHPPVTRVSLFVDLLPYMGRGDLFSSINRNQAWYERGKDDKTPGNIDAAGAWVPELLVPYYPQSAWRATSPYAPDHVLGATNYVAIAGSGQNIARDGVDLKTGQIAPAFKTKVGISGYGWNSKVSDVTDGLSNTIYLMTTPPGLQQPWMAGGGATVRGLDENNPMDAFAYDHPDGKGGTKQGAYALMGDGSVRWIPAKIDKKVLLALSTRAGGDAEKGVLADLDNVAPKVELPKPPEPKKEEKPGDKKPEDKKTDPKAVDPKGTDPKKPADKPADKKDGAKPDIAPPPTEKK